MPDFLRVFRRCFFCKRRGGLEHVDPLNYSYHSQCLTIALAAPANLGRVREIAERIAHAQAEQRHRAQNEAENAQAMRETLLRHSLERIGIQTSSTNMDWSWTTTTISQASPVELSERDMGNIGIGSSPSYRVEVTRVPHKKKKPEESKELDKQNKMRKIFEE